MGSEIANEFVLALGIGSSGTASPAMSVDTTLIAGALLVSLHHLSPSKVLLLTQGHDSCSWKMLNRHVQAPVSDVMKSRNALMTWGCTCAAFIIFWKMEHHLRALISRPMTILDKFWWKIT
jgi:hypothetical protein